jgi:hypothetical protein
MIAELRNQITGNAESELDRCKACRYTWIPSSAVLWSRHAHALRRHSLQGRHDDMLVGANAEAAAHLLTRCLEAALYKVGI